ncbi:cobalt-precorrin-4/precorrin-4 C(11)-methyltransferase, partial [Actinokineospora bangkokensis]
MRGVVSFVGAGPGAADLMTLRGADRLAAADVVLFSPVLVDPVWLRAHTRDDADLVDLTRLSDEELLDLHRRVGSRLARAVRLVPGDPALSADLREQRETCERLGLDVEVVPGVSPISATAAAVGAPLLEPGADTLSLVEGVDAARAVATPGRTLVVHAPAARAADLAEVLRTAGFPEDVPVAVAYKVTSPAETLLRTTLADLTTEVKKANLWRHAHFIIGDTTRQPTRPTTDPSRWTARARRPKTDGEPRHTWSRPT